MKNLKNITAIFLFFGFFAILFIVANGYIEYNYSKKEIVNDLQSILLEKTKIVDEFIYVQEGNFNDAYDEELFKTFLKMSREDSEYNDTREKLYKKFNQSDEVVMGLINSTGIFQIDKEGILEGFDIKEYPEGIEYLADTSKGVSYMILPHPKLDKFYILIVTKIFDDDGSFLGIFSYRVPNRELESLVNNIEEFDGIGESYLINDNYFLLTHSKFLKGNNSGRLIQIINTSNAVQCVNNYLIPLKKGEKIDVLERGVVEYVTYRGEEVLGVHDVIEIPRWCILVEISKKDISRILFERVILTRTIVLIFIMLILSIAYCLFKKKN